MDSTRDNNPAKVLRRRPQVRINQQRYRLKQQDANAARVREVLELNRDVARCQGRIQALERSLLRMHEPEVHVVLEYCRLFHTGYAPHLPLLHKQQRAFVSAVAMPNMLFQGEKRVEKLWEQWHISHALFSTFELEPPAIDSISLDATTVLRVSTTLHLGLTWQSITALFPHALDQPNLAERLVGHLDTMAATPVAMADLLGSLDDAVTALLDSRLLENAELDVRLDDFK
ncbi:hypothetical protein SDRG_10376 [Saprolegnia diclina VS20]|uniref:BZIP domain-containing protein n=1 Tax=Saprolegnia diclina (strain VS20) TaxID=1156394 RepID=T0RIK3_SAPDV|nr:hypothetical protein SDRG_10376 [Saprolegnia diclina VS20]EQC32183.1 hypothetical protein SDRG_10376 [Saprolegnia diclina VS20]|eukprot:XP_008614585.1 hypothetical protein SDRG_10376 [Saprolegnia diclina VS20]